MNARPDSAQPAALTPSQRILLARENLCLSMALYAASHQGFITTSFVAPAAEVRLRNGDVIDARVPLDLADDAALVRCVANQIRGAFALSVLQTHRELETAYPGAEPLDEPDADLRLARVAIHLLSASVQRDLMAPLWRVSPAYRRRHFSPALELSLDATELDGREVRWEHFGGLPRYLDITLFLAQQLLPPAAGISPTPLPNNYGRVRELANRPSTEASQQRPPGIAPGFGSGAGRLRRPSDARASDGEVAGWIAPEGIPQPRISIASQASEAGAVADFVSDACSVGEKAMTPAGDLYTCYARWCLENGYLSVSQRKFGLELAAGGYQRKRRGKGKHWWMGLQPRD
jgi:hypothetical protein